MRAGLRRASVPANLLLAGEYAVLEEGGLGLTAALETRVHFTLEPAPAWELVGLWPGQEQVWRVADGENGSLAGAVWAQLSGEGLWPGGPPYRLTADSSAFFDAQGRKAGFGSSAATAAGWTALLIQLGGVHEDHVLERSLLPAIRAHRRFQGGRGSGYDVACSLGGGLGLFSGGKNPAWVPVVAPWRPPFSLVAGPEAVRTSSSIGAYTAWKQAQPDAAADFLRASNAQVRALALASSWHRARPLLAGLRDQGLQLGRAIGVDANLPDRHRWELPGTDLVLKALGAGNELALLAGEAAHPAGSRSLSVAEQGFRWD